MLNLLNINLFKTYYSMIESESSEYTETIQLEMLFININNIIYNPSLPNKGIRETNLFIILSFTMIFITSFFAWSKNLTIWYISPVTL